ncbi:MAG: hypothetical protein IPK46_11095 [Saprospiraceae bacterium]|nr:hypothetical protein [Saprospiraceae bacterium]
MIKVMKWHDKTEPFIGYEPVFDPDSGQATGMDLKALQEGLNELKETEFLTPLLLPTTEPLLDHFIPKFKIKKLNLQKVIWPLMQKRIPGAIVRMFLMILAGVRCMLIL